eukprot:TRINITY_DN197_c0_g1_i4.p1 TRINITY_DN197_c0_g1~~TRINITY_DN197_c0_g1_i4.p1  ORF type:complete len:109 (-),score=16.29 TRINITY_DN197_c0_g1_i4:759-1085(-)
MVGRGELGFVVAKMAKNMGLLSEISFCACIWALLLATILGPFMFQFFLRWDPPAEAEGDGSYQSINGHSVGMDEHGSREKRKCILQKIRFLHLKHPEFVSVYNMKHQI